MAAGPDIKVHHFIGCLNAPWDGVPGPNTPRTLEGVALQYGVPPDAEPWFEFPEFWFYARIFRTSPVKGYRKFAIIVHRQHTDGRTTRIHQQKLGRVRFSRQHPNANVAWPIRMLRFPGLGYYEFRLAADVDTYLGTRYRVVAREYVEIVRKV